jgi:nitroreductase
MTGHEHRVDVSETIRLPQPTEQNEPSICFNLRHTIRDISPADISLQLLSDLLWAAYGINRLNGPCNRPGRTAASASDSQEIDLYVAMLEAIYLYDARAHQLVPKVHGDFRNKALTPGQKNVSANGPVHLIYVADIHRFAHTAGFDEPGLQDPEIQKSYYFVDTGLIAGNVFLFAAMRGLAAWFHNCDRKALSQLLNLDSDKRVLFAQSVGYPDVP